MTISLLGNAAHSISSANAPTGVSPTYTTPTTAGNLLVLFVAVTGSSPTITTPANWSVGRVVTGATLTSGVYYYANNPGGITTVSITLAGTTGGGVTAAVFEYSGLNDPTPSVVTNVFSSGTGTAIADFTPNRPVDTGDTLCIAAFARVAAFSLTPSFDSFYPWSTSQQASNSTGSTTNAQQDFFWFELPSVGPMPNVSGTNSGSTTWVTSFLRFSTGNSYRRNLAFVGGTNGVLAGQFYQGMIGG